MYKNICSIHDVSRIINNKISCSLFVTNAFEFQNRYANILSGVRPVIRVRFGTWLLLSRCESTRLSPASLRSYPSIKRALLGRIFPTFACGYLIIAWTRGPCFNKWQISMIDIPIHKTGQPPVSDQSDCRDSARHETLTFDPGMARSDWRHVSDRSRGKGQ